MLKIILGGFILFLRFISRRMKIMNCHQFSRNWYRALDGQASESERQQLDLHLKGCPRCRQEAESMAACHHLLKSPQPLLPPSPGFDALLWQKIAERAGRSWIRRLFQGAEELALAAGLPRVLAVFLIAFLAGFTSQAVVMVTSSGRPPASAAAPSLSGFKEYRGIPAASLSGVYLTMTEKRTEHP